MANTQRQRPPTTPAPPAVDDSVRRDGGKPTDEEHVPKEQLEKIKHNAADHDTRAEPGS